jgi:uncharacterized membrane protein YfcA
MLNIFLLCFIFGSFSGILAGLFGVGGGLVLVPFFLFILSFNEIGGNQVMLIAIATSLASIIVTSLFASWAHYRLGNLLKMPVLHLSLGMIVGVLLGAYAANTFAFSYLQIIFGVYLLLASLQMVAEYKPKQKEIHLNKNNLKIAGSIIGFVAAFLGIGGGTLTVPYLAKHGVKIKNAVAISSACGFSIAVMGSLSYMVLGWNAHGLPEGSLGYIYIPAFLGVILSSALTASVGANLANKLPAEKLKRYFSLLLFGVALKVLWSSA